MNRKHHLTTINMDVIRRHSNSVVTCGAMAVVRFSPAALDVATCSAPAVTETVCLHPRPPPAPNRPAGGRRGAGRLRHALAAISKYDMWTATSIEFATYFTVQLGISTTSIYFSLHSSVEQCCNLYIYLFSILC